VKPNPKSEGRRPKETRNPKSESRIGTSEYAEEKGLPGFWFPYYYPSNFSLLEQIACAITSRLLNLLFAIWYRLFFGCGSAVLGIPRFKNRMLSEFGFRPSAFFRVSGFGLRVSTVPSVLP
jgi:hypothetical protein